MKLGSVIRWAALGVVASSAGAMAIPLPWSAKTPTVQLREDPVVAKSLSHFAAGQTLAVDGRLGHATIAKTGRGETFLFTSITGADRPSVKAPPLNLSVVIDRSGSMKGDRLPNALTAAIGTVERMRDGDSVSIVSFDTESTVVVPPTLTTNGTRASIEAAIRSIRLGGDTCISCGLDEGMRQLDRTSLGAERVNRMILLSNGATNHGVRDLPGLRAMADHMSDRGVTISTIGLGLDFDERVMTQIAAEGNGQHYSVETASTLGAIFSQEFDELLASVASDAELAIELPQGVEVDEVFDRTFRREGQRVIVPFGTFSAKQEKTVLMKLKVPADQDGVQPVADVRLTYRDLVSKGDGGCEGKLAVMVSSDPNEVQKDLDPFVATRLERSRTAQTLSEVNRLFEDGKVKEALDRLKKQEDNVAKTEALTRAAPRMARPAPPMHNAPKPDFDDDLSRQRDTLNKAAANIAPASAPTTAPSSSAGKWGRKENAARSLELRK